MQVGRLGEGEITANKDVYKVSNQDKLKAKIALVFAIVFTIIVGFMEAGAGFFLAYNMMAHSYIIILATSGALPGLAAVTLFALSLIFYYKKTKVVEKKSEGMLPPPTSSTSELSNLRAKIKKEIVEVAGKTGNEKILEAGFNSLSNHAFHKISDKVRQEIGLPLSERAFPEWQKWLNEEIKKKRI